LDALGIVDNAVKNGICQGRVKDAHQHVSMVHTDGAKARIRDMAQRVWALPFLAVLAPSENYCQERKRAHK